MRNAMITSAAVIFAALTFVTPQSYAQDAKTDKPVVTLPGGATTLQETFDNWVVTCGIADNKKLCVATQQQAQQNGQRVLAVEVKPQASNTRFDVVLPFGLLVSEGITYQIGDKGTVSVVKIKTCFPGGCIATFNLEREELNALRTAPNMIIKGKVENNPDGVTFTIPTLGFSAAYDRLTQLMK